eukprot:6206299-Pleurochrysis_carterae.AAC.2
MPLEQRTEKKVPSLTAVDARRRAANWIPSAAWGSWIVWSAVGRRLHAFCSVSRAVLPPSHRPRSARQNSLQQSSHCGGD